MMRGPQVCGPIVAGTGSPVPREHRLRETAVWAAPAGRDRLGCGERAGGRGIGQPAPPTQSGRSWGVVQGVATSNTLEVTMSTTAELYEQDVFAWPQTTAARREGG